MSVDTIVLHVMAGTLAGTDAWFSSKKSGVSTHYGIGYNGELHQYVDESDTAYHAGSLVTNRRSIGIEHEGKHPDWPTGYWIPNYQQLAKSHALVVDILQRYRLDASHVFGHGEVANKPTCPGPGLNMMQYKQVVTNMLLQASRPKDSLKDKEATNADSISLVFGIGATTDPMVMEVNLEIRIGNKTYKTNIKDVKFEEEE